MMSSNFWYLDRDHTQRGPVGEDEFVRLIRQGVITRETMMWTAGMSEWRPAGQVPSVAALFGASAPAIGAGAPVVGAPAHLRSGGDGPAQFRRSPCGVFSGARWSRSSAWS